MFTGIIKGIGTVEAIVDKPGLRQFQIRLPEGADTELERGASIAVDGVCLTVTSFADSIVTFDVMQESLSLTTLGSLVRGSKVNIERAARDGAEIGGHPISGHVDCRATVARIDTPDNNKVLTFEVPPAWMKYIFPKGYVALNGTSLTITNVDRAARTFEVWFIPETLRMTTFGEKRVGDSINLEVERGTLVTVDTIRSFMEERFGKLLPALEKLLEQSGSSLESLGLEKSAPKDRS